MVYVIAGDSRGQQGKVLAVDPEKQRAIVEGVNMCKKAEKPNAKNPQGGIVEKEAPIHISKPTRVGRKADAKGKLVRYAKKSGEEIK